MSNASQTVVNFPTAREVEAATQSQRVLAACLTTKFETQRVQILNDNHQACEVELPTSALRLLADALAALADGDAVQVVTIREELNLHEAADLLNVSVTYLVKLLEQGDLPHHKAGNHRRVLFADLMRFKVQRERASEQVMQELTEQARGIDYG